TMEVEAVDEGTLGKILVPDGTEDVQVNQVIALLLEEGEDAGALDGYKGGNGSGKAASGRQEKAEDDDGDEADAEAPKETGQEKSGADSGTDSGKAKAEVSSLVNPNTPEAAPEPDVGKTRQMTVREALRDAVAEEMRRDKSVFIMGEEVAEYEGAYKITQGLLAEFGARRVIDTPITEHGFAGLGVGAAFGKLKPIVEFMTFNFAMQAIDQIINSAAKTLYMSGGQMGCPMVFRGPNGAAARVAAQHSQCYARWFVHVPGLKVIAPYSGADHKGLLKAAIRDPNPVIFLENEILYGQSFEVPEDEDFVLPIGRAKIEREGADVTITAFSLMVARALEAAEKLAEEGIDAEVINLRTLRPLDTGTIVESVKKTNRLVTVEEGWAFSGIGSELAAVAMEQAFDYLDAPVARVAGKDVPMPYAANLERMTIPQVDDVVAAAKAVCYR
ncbi:MAG: pyruvate dehydrogenase complex E1 component subunit beta, partial [Acetobacterales bacterium]